MMGEESDILMHPGIWTDRSFLIQEGFVYNSTGFLKLSEEQVSDLELLLKGRLQVTDETAL